MITFACKKIEQEELIRCSFDLNKTEYNVLLFLLKNRNTNTVSDIAKNMRLERTTVQKAIKTLVHKNLVRRMQKNLSKGGYIYYYNVENKDEIKGRMKKIVHDWYNVVEREIDNL